MNLILLFNLGCLLENTVCPLFASIKTRKENETANDGRKHF